MAAVAVILLVSGGVYFLWSTVSPAAECIDTDGHLSLEESYLVQGYTKGVKEGKNGTFFDSCVSDPESQISIPNSSYLAEGYCTKRGLEVKIVECSYGCWNRECLPQRECDKFIMNALDSRTRDEDKQLEIKKIADFQCYEAIPALISLISDAESPESVPILRSSIITLARLDAEEAVAPIGKILETTQDKSVFGSAAAALGQLGGERNISSKQALKILIENEGRDSVEGFNSGSIGASVAQFENEILNILDDPDSDYLSYAVSAVRYSLFRQASEEETVSTMIALLPHSDNEITKELLKLVRLLGSKEQAGEVIEIVPKKDAYAEEWDALYIYNMSKPIEGTQVAS